LPGDLRHGRCEVSEGVQHDPLRLFEAPGACCLADRGVAVVILQSVDTEQARLEPVVAVNQRMTALAGVEKRSNRRAVDLVGQVPRIHRILVAA